MMELVRSWLVGITCAALIVALAEALTPEGPVKRIGKLAGGLVLVLAILRPVVGLDYSALSSALAGRWTGTAGYSAALELENRRLMERIISERAGAYIQDKAAELGLTVQAGVDCEAQEDGTPYPASAVITGALTQAEEDSLRRLIEAELAIPAGRQRYERTDES